MPQRKVKRIRDTVSVAEALYNEWEEANVLIILSNGEIGYGYTYITDSDAREFDDNFDIDTASPDEALYFRAMMYQCTFAELGDPIPDDDEICDILQPSPANISDCHDLLESINAILSYWGFHILMPDSDVPIYNCGSAAKALSEWQRDNTLVEDEYNFILYA